MSSVIPRSEQLALDELALKDWMTDLSEAPPPPGPRYALYSRYMNIDYIHCAAIYMWVGNSVNRPHTDFDAPPPWNPTLQDVEYIITSAARTRVSMNGKLIQILQYRGRYNVDLNSPLLGEHLTYLNSLCNEFESPIIHTDLPYDISHIYTVYGTGRTTRTARAPASHPGDARIGEGEDEDAFDYDSEEDAEYPMEPLSPETIRIINRNLDAEFLAEADAITHSITTEAAERRLQETETHNSLCSEGVNILDRIMDTDTRELKEGDYLTLMNLFRDLHT